MCEFDVEKAVAFLTAIPTEEARANPGTTIPFTCPICGGTAQATASRINLHIHTDCPVCGTECHE